MKLKAQMTTIAALTVSALALAGTATGQDAHERGKAVSGQAAIAYFDANERATLAKSPGENAIEYFRANEMATLGSAGSTALVGYVDGPQRIELLTQPTGFEVADGSGFDWSSAAVGASSALMLALLIGVSLVTVRRLRTGPYAH
jgi:hypothetical protein